MTRAVCPGSFDPVTNGHLDIFRRAAGIFDELVVATGTNPSKSRLFDPAARLEMLREVCADLPNVTVMGFSGLIVDFCREIDAQGAALKNRARGNPQAERILGRAQIAGRQGAAGRKVTIGDPHIVQGRCVIPSQPEHHGGDHKDGRHTRPDARAVAPEQSPDLLGSVRGRPVRRIEGSRAAGVAVLHLTTVARAGACRSRCPQVIAATSLRGLVACRLVRGLGGSGLGFGRAGRLRLGLRLFGGLAVGGRCR